MNDSREERVGARAQASSAHHPVFQVITEAKCFAASGAPRQDVTVLITYFVLGCVVYKLVEGWSFLDSVYFMVVTSTTVGYGDICPVTQLGRAFTIVYALLGISVVFGTLNPFINPALEWLVETVVRHVPWLQPKVSNSLKVSLQEARKQVSYTRRYARAMIPTMALLVVGIVIGILIEAVEEGATLVDAAYFGVITMSTIGYGDLGPKSSFDKFLMILYLPFATSALAKMLSDFERIATNRAIRETDYTTSETLSSLLLEEAVHQEKGDDTTALSEAEFLVARLRDNGLVDDSTIAAIRRQYRHVLSTASDEARADGDCIHVRLVFERLDAEGLIQERPDGVPEGAMRGSVRLVKRGAADRGFGEWMQHHWAQRVAEAQARADEAEAQDAAGPRSSFSFSRSRGGGTDERHSPDARLDPYAQLLGGDEGGNGEAPTGPRDA